MLNIITQRWNEFALGTSWLILLCIAAHICWDVMGRNRQKYPKEIQLLGFITLLSLISALVFAIGYLGRPL